MNSELAGQSQTSKAESTPTVRLQSRMDGHYREPRSQRPPTAYQNEHAATGNVQQRAQDNVQAQEASGPTRYCSIKGCSNALLPGYDHRMCEPCRGRHRIYAMTKRAKRKMEKAALLGNAFQNEDGQGNMEMSPADPVQIREVSRYPHRLEIVWLSRRAL